MNNKIAVKSFNGLKNKRIFFPATNQGTGLAKSTRGENEIHKEEKKLESFRNSFSLESSPNSTARHNFRDKVILTDIQRTREKTATAGNSKNPMDSAYNTSQFFHKIENQRVIENF